MDATGGINLKKEFGEQALTIFLSPPSIEVLENRLISRGTETPDSLKKRVIKARSEILKSQNYDVSIINLDLDETKSKVLKLVKDYLP